jgi:hypothetical protein
LLSTPLGRVVPHLDAKREDHKIPAVRVPKGTVVISAPKRSLSTSKVAPHKEQAHYKKLPALEPLTSARATRSGYLMSLGAPPSKSKDLKQAKHMARDYQKKKKR